MPSQSDQPKGQKPKKPDPDHNLAVEQLNGEFYGAKPYDYFEQRLISLLLMVADSEHVASALRDGVGIGTFAVKNAERRPENEATAYAATEAIVLLHHATEALFRLYFAHVGAPPCPWLEVSRVTFGGEFKKKLDSLLSSLDTPETRSDVAKVFRGADTYGAVRSAFSGTEEQWAEQINGIVELLRLVGSRLINEGPLYNAAKHGFTVVAGERGIKLNAGPGVIIGRDGPPKYDNCDRRV